MYLDLEQLEKLSTPRLLAYFKKHRKGDEHNAEYFDGIRAILNKRGHVETEQTSKNNKGNKS